MLSNLETSLEVGSKYIETWAVISKPVLAPHFNEELLNITGYTMKNILERTAQFGVKNYLMLQSGLQSAVKILYFLMLCSSGRPCRRTVAQTIGIFITHSFSPVQVWVTVSPDSKFSISCDYDWLWKYHTQYERWEGILHSIHHNRHSLLCLFDQHHGGSG